MTSFPHLLFPAQLPAMDWDFISREIRPLLDRAERFDAFLVTISRASKDRVINAKGVARLPFLDAINHEKLAQVRMGIGTGK